MLIRLSILGLALVVAALACSTPPTPPMEAKRAAEEAQPEAAEHAAHPHAGHQHDEAHQQHEAPPAAAEPGLVRIADPGNICMLSNRYLGEKQYVPVEVEGKTYFGCCAGCAGKLGQTARARVAVDPVNGKPVDKAHAVLARDEHGKVLYFESEATFAQAREAKRASQAAR